MDSDKTSNFIQSYGFKADFKTQKKDIYFAGEKLTNQIPEEIYVDYVLGGAMMIRTSLLKTIGLFEENYFLYNNDLDICLLYTSPTPRDRTRYLMPSSV